MKEMRMEKEEMKKMIVINAVQENQREVMSFQFSSLNLSRKAY